MEQEIIQTIQNLKQINNCGTSDFIEAKNIAFDQCIEAIKDLFKQSHSTVNCTTEDKEPTTKELNEEIAFYFRNNSIRAGHEIARHFYNLGRRLQAST